MENLQEALFDAGFGPDSAQGEADAPASAGSPRALNAAREVAFVDTAAPDFDALLAVLSQACEVVVVRPGGDVLAQLVDALAARPAMDTIHVFAHGLAGNFRFGGAPMDEEAFERLAHHLRAEAFGPGVCSRLLLYRLFRRS